MENQTNNKSAVITASVLMVVGVMAFSAFKNHQQPSQLESIAQALETASKQNDKAAASQLFDKLTTLKYQYSDANNIPCLQAVMTLTGGADEVNATGTWSNKQESIAAINQCKA